MSLWSPVTQKDVSNAGVDRRRIRSMSPVALGAERREVSPSEEAFCWRLPSLKPGRTYLAVYPHEQYPSDTTYQDSIFLESTLTPGAAPPAPRLSGMEGTDLYDACSDHGYFVPVLASSLDASSEGDAAWAYEWEVRDVESKVVVQRGLDQNPYVFAMKRGALFYTNEFTRAAESSKERGLESGNGAYHEGRRYKFVMRAVNWRGQRSEAQRRVRQGGECGEKAAGEGGEQGPSPRRRPRCTMARSEGIRWR